MKNKLTEKIQDIVMDMMKRVKFTDDGHTYQNTETGEWLQGVSSVSSIIPKDWLSAWGAKEAVKFLGYSDYEGDVERAEEVLQQIRELTPDIDGKSVAEKFITILKEAKGASGRKSKTALVDGKRGHEWLEQYVLSQIRETKAPEIPTDALKRPIEQFLAWEEENVSYWILAEARVANLDKKYAGTMDALAMMKSGKLAVIDFKFASHISEDYFLQTAGYQACFEAYDIKIDQRIIVRLPKTLEREEWDKINKKYYMVENNLEVKIVDTDYELDKQTFFHCLFVKKWINQFRKKQKINKSP